MRLFIFIILVCSVNFLYAQDSALLHINLNRKQINKTGFIIMTAWASGNIITGSIAQKNTEGSTKYFHQMNTYWNLVNLGLAGYGFYSASRSNTRQSLTQSLKTQANTERLFLFNAGLDVAYVATGLYLKERANSSTQIKNKLKGYGNNLLLQGSFLFLFDAAMYGIHHKNGFALYKLIDATRLSIGPSGATAQIHL